MSINATLIGQMITFALLVWFTMKYVWPPLMQAMEERQKRIAEGLAAADKGKEEMELAEKRAKKLLKEAKDQAAEIVTMRRNAPTKWSTNPNRPREPKASAWWLSLSRKSTSRCSRRRNP